MSRESIDITDQIKSELFGHPLSGSGSVADLAHSSPHPHSRMQNQQCMRRRPTAPGSQADGIPSAERGRYAGLRDREGDIVLQRGISHPDDSGFCFGDISGCRVSFYLAIWVGQGCVELIDGAQIILRRTSPRQTPRDMSVFLPSRLGTFYSKFYTLF